jgi:methionyl-tRNA synthetase
VIKEDPQRAGTTVYTALRAIDSLKILFSPFLPFSSEHLHKTLGYQDQLFGELHIESYREQQRSHEVLEYDGAKAQGRWEPSQLEPNQTLVEPKPLFPKLDEEVIEEERSKLRQVRD